MNLSEMKKEQKQLAVLGVMTVVVVVALGNQLVIGPARAKAEKARELLEAEGSKKDSGERLLSRDARTHRDLIQDIASMTAIREEGALPPVDGKEFWAQKRLRMIGYDVGVDLAVSRHSSPQPRYIGARGGENETQLSFWVPYTVKINARLSFSQLKELLAAIRQAEPYASIGSLKVTPSSLDPTRHNVQINVEWPVPRREEEWAGLRTRLPES